VWSGPPLSNYSRCEQAWVDGRRYFDIEYDRKMRERDDRLRSQLVQAILAGDAPTSKTDENGDEPSTDGPTM
jgi:N-acetylglucosamine-6-phosphate deacetylase